MSDSIQVKASLAIERPLEVVREYYRDVDHRIRSGVHRDIRYAWEPTAGGERRIRTTFRVLGVEQHDLSMLEDGADGSVVLRCLEGTNTGMVLVHRFLAAGPSTTTVELSADAPKTLSRKLLGPVFAVGLRQVLRKTLAEDKADLERGAFVAGRASGNIENALAFLCAPAAGAVSFVRPLAERSAAAKRAVLEATCLLAVADGRVEQTEVDAVGRVALLIGASDERPWLAERARELANAAASARIHDEAKRIGATLVEQGVALEGITAAVVTALVNEGMSLGELELLRVLANVAGIAEGALPALVENAERGLAAAP